jgi:hypothetical protein
MSVVFLASFPDSRTYPRPATKYAVTSAGIIPVGVVTPVISGDDNTTYVTIRNISLVDDLYFFYKDVGTAAPSLSDILNDGMKLEAGDAYEIESKQDVYCATAGGAPVLFRLDHGFG